jgi:hypothetical protein
MHNLGRSYTAMPDILEKSNHFLSLVESHITSLQRKQLDVLTALARELKLTCPVGRAARVVNLIIRGKLPFHAEKTKKFGSQYSIALKAVHFKDAREWEKQVRHNINLRRLDGDGETEREKLEESRTIPILDLLQKATANWDMAGALKICNQLEALDLFTAQNLLLEVKNFEQDRPWTEESRELKNRLILLSEKIIDSLSPDVELLTRYQEMSIPELRLGITKAIQSGAPKTAEEIRKVGSLRQQSSGLQMGQKVFIRSGAAKGKPGKVLKISHSGLIDVEIDVSVEKEGNQLQLLKNVTLASSEIGEFHELEPTNN